MEAGDRLVSVVATEAELNWVMDKGFSVISATSAVDWVVAEALRRAQGLTGRPGRPRIVPVRDGRVMPKDSHPDSWDGLAQFVNQGGQYRVTDRTLRGGVDPDDPREQDGVKLAESLNWTEIDECYELVARQEEPDQAREGSFEHRLAQALYERSSLEQHQLIQSIPAMRDTRAVLSPARIISLKGSNGSEEMGPTPDPTLLVGDMGGGTNQQRAGERTNRRPDLLPRDTDSIIRDAGTDVPSARKLSGVGNS